MDASFTTGIFEESALVFGVCHRLLRVAVDFGLATSLAGDHSKFRNV
jgi:hypothetical protein